MIRIIAGTTANDSRIVDVETGKGIDGVFKVEMSVDINEPTKAILHMYADSIETNVLPKDVTIISYAKGKVNDR